MVFPHQALRAPESPPSADSLQPPGGKARKNAHQASTQAEQLGRHRRTEAPLCTTPSVSSPGLPCPWASLSFRQRRFSILGGPVLGTSVAGLLGELLHEELATWWERLLLDDAFTGGALAWVPGRTPQVGQLVYPAGGALDKLYFQEVSVAPGGDPQALGDPGHIQLRGPVRQVVTHTVQGEALLAVRSDYHCALWKVSKQGRPAPLRVLQIGKGATGISLRTQEDLNFFLFDSHFHTCCLTTHDEKKRQTRETPRLAAYCVSKATAWPGGGSLSCRPSCPAAFGRSPAGPAGRTETLGDLPIRAPKSSRARAAPSSLTPVPALGPPSSAAEAWGCPSLSSSFSALGATAGSQGSWPRLAEGCQGLGLGLICNDAARRGFLRPPSSVPGAALAVEAMAERGDPRGQLTQSRSDCALLRALARLHNGVSCTAAAPLWEPEAPGPLPLLPPGPDPWDPGVSARDLLFRGGIPFRRKPRAVLDVTEQVGLAAALLPSASAPVLFLFQLSTAGDVFHQRLRLQADPGLASGAPVASWTPQATARCGRWLKALLEVPLPPPVWAAPNFSHRRVLGCVEPRRMEQKVPEGLRAAMAEGRLLLRRDLGAAPSAEPPPAPEPGPKDELSARLEAAWEGRAAAWWESQQGGSSGPGKRPQRHKRRTQLSSTFSSLSGRLDLSDATSPPRSPDRTSPEARPQPPVTPPSQELTQEPWAQGVPSERQQTLRDYMAKLPLRGDPPGGVSSPLSQASSVRATPSGQQPLQDGSAERPLRRHTLGGAAVPSSQTSSVRATPSRQQAPVPSGSRPRRKKPRMGF
ncbi:TATA box-binding protein-associated factor RNA polymerase I subunit C [Puma concolor]|uniref:TATA box-binding protein-associated factor RNA polymerase I subunit C n=1 Tax=Puma concolor TaxID=9696 RepID=A0A6P6HLP7_PUMCO|nr:TATA box-binding protein-associated factor RNA polymerase I subunit C [Puma concolor]